MPSVLDELPEPTRTRVLQVARRRTFARGEVVFHREDPGHTRVPDRAALRARADRR